MKRNPQDCLFDDVFAVAGTTTPPSPLWRRGAFWSPTVPERRFFGHSFSAIHSNKIKRRCNEPKPNRGSIAKLPQFLLVKLNNAIYRVNLSAIPTCPINNNINYGMSDVEVGIFIATASVEAPAAVLVAATRVE